MAPFNIRFKREGIEEKQKRTKNNEYNRSCITSIAHKVSALLWSLVQRCHEVLCIRT